MKWFIKCLRQYADFKGRARRKEYWWFAVVNFIITMVFLIPYFVQMFKLGLSGVELSEKEVYGYLFSMPYFWIYVVYYVAMLLPGLAVCVRRLHDIGRSGWWTLFIFSASILNLVGNVIKDSSFALSILITFVALAISVVGLIWMFTDSQPGENKWGPNPKEPLDYSTEPQQ